MGGGEGHPPQMTASARAQLGQGQEQLLLWVSHKRSRGPRIWTIPGHGQGAGLEVDQPDTDWHPCGMLARQAAALPTAHTSAVIFDFLETCV